MIHIIPPEGRRLIFYLAMEEYFARQRQDVFFTWQTGPTVICGRNQDINVEANLQYCREHDIRVFRRKSGGGTVYSDFGNLMISYVTSISNVEEAFSIYLDRIVSIMQDLGLDARKSGRNDIMIGDKKISGNAFYALLDTKMSIVHGTLLYFTNMENMLNSITPSKSKLASHAVTSVAQRIGLLRDILPSGKYECEGTSVPKWLLDSVISGFCEGTSQMTACCEGERYLTEEEIRRIEELETTYETIN